MIRSFIKDIINIIKEMPIFRESICTSIMSTKVTLENYPKNAHIEFLNNIGESEKIINLSDSLGKVIMDPGDPFGGYPVILKVKKLEISNDQYEVYYSKLLDPDKYSYEDKVIYLNKESKVLELSRWPNLINRVRYYNYVEGKE